MDINVKDIYDILSKHYEKHSSLYLTREVNGRGVYFHNFCCPKNTRQIIEAMDAMSQTGEVQVESMEARFYEKKISAFRCRDYMIKVSDHKTANSHYISISFYGITGMVVKKAYGKHEVKLSYDPKHFLNIYINAGNGDVYGKGVGNGGALYPMSFSSYVNKLLLHSNVFKEIFRDILQLCSGGHNLIRDIVRTIDEEGFVAMPITVFDIRKNHTKDEMIRRFTGTDLSVNFNKRSLNHGYLIAELARIIPSEQVGYMIQLNPEMVVNILRDIYKEVYPLEGFSGEFIVRYYIRKLGMTDSRANRTLIRDYVRLAEDHELPVSIKFRTVNRLVREHNRLAELYHEKELAAETSQPLIAENTRFAELRRILPEEFEWITATGRLYEEGERQQNCVFSYREILRKDQSAIYHWEKEDRSYTIEFGCCPDGRYTVEQMLQKNNRTADSEDVEYVKKCLGKHLGKSFDKADAGNGPRIRAFLEGPEDEELPFM